MEGGSSDHSTGEKSSELGTLQTQYEQKLLRILELKSQIQSVKLQLEKRKKEVPEDNIEVFKSLVEKYNILRDEYNALLAEKSTVPDM